MTNRFAQRTRLITAAAAAVAGLGMLALQAPQAANGADAPLRPDGPALQRLHGVYASADAESWGGAYGTREFSFDRGRWTLRFTLALDPKMQQPVFEFRTHGRYTVQAASKAVPGAFEALFTEDAKYVTLKTTDAKLAAAFGLAGCGLSPGVERDISVTGCANWKPVAQCAEDHDLLALDTRGGLYFGVRPRDNDMCTADKRPTALLPAVWRR